MDGKPAEAQSFKTEPSRRQLSVFEMSVNLEFQMDSPQKGNAIPKAGNLCPQCQSAEIDYDGMLNLSCPDCGYTLAGCFT